MCGIAGIVSRGRPAPPRSLEAMLHAMRHRGPDGSGTFHHRDVSLGHCRLAVLDPTPTGAQPMSDSTGRYVCTFNGAIYNFRELRRTLEQQGIRFRSTGDTEVLVEAYAAWGAAALDRLNGMFAFGIYDRTSGELFCARDRLGVKPFVYTSTADVFAFASEHKALIEAGLAGRTMSADGVYEFIAQGHVRAGNSLFEDIRALPPGWALRVGTDRRERLWQWWRLGDGPARDTSAADHAEFIRDLLVDATRIRLRSDVPLGTHLSGGLDSSAVTAAAAVGGGRDIATFTGAFDGHARADERVWSRLVAAETGFRAIEVELDVEALAEVFLRVMWHMDEPTAGPGVLPAQLVYDATKRAGVKVVLSGHGGDELFGGYLRHRGVYFRQVARRSGTPAQRAGAAIELAKLATEARGRLVRSQTVHDSDLCPDLLDRVDPEVRRRARAGPGSFRSAAELMRWDLEHYLPGLLHAEDRVSMAASIESRAPLLDYRIVEAANSIPERSHFRRCTSKPVLRDAVAPWLPRRVAERRDKRGFPTPLDRWSSRPRMTGLVRELTHRRGGDQVFDQAFLRRPEAMSAGQLWTVMTMQAWLAGDS